MVLLGLALIKIAYICGLEDWLYWEDPGLAHQFNHDFESYGDHVDCLAREPSRFLQKIERPQRNPVLFLLLFVLFLFHIVLFDHIPIIIVLIQIGLRSIPHIPHLLIPIPIRHSPKHPISIRPIPIILIVPFPIINISTRTIHNHPVPNRCSYSPSIPNRHIPISTCRILIENPPFIHRPILYGPILYGPNASFIWQSSPVFHCNLPSVHKTHYIK